MELRIALPIARIYHARGLTQTQTQTQLMLDGAEPWVARFATGSAFLFDAEQCGVAGGGVSVLGVAEQLARRNAQQLTTAELADRLLAIAEALNLEVSLVSVARATTSGQSPSHRTASSRTSDRSL